MASSVPTDQGTSFVLDDAEWDFNGHVLPDEEVRACLIWECGRESFDLYAAEWAEELEAKAQPTRWDAKAQKHIKNSARSRKKALEELNDLAFDLDGHRDRLFRSHQAFNGFYWQVTQYARPWSKPWQRFPAELRQDAIKRLNDPGIFPPLQPAMLRDLEGLWTTNGKEIIDLRTGVTEAKYDDTLEMLGYESSEPVEMPKDERDPDVRELTAAFTINFSLYTDREIIETFSAWLKTARSCPEPIRKGKKINDDRAALDGIGIMRAFHHYPFSHPHFPSKLKNMGRRHCDKLRELALRRFHEVLPFVPTESLPLSWERATRATKSL
ncbi:MAG: hypothetical protein K1X78_02605 [Verrucomicrobiaceae bacterium]|nr:hypothetical protein [Verrucomicrobiaceae bacterium]